MDYEINLLTCEFHPLTMTCRMCYYLTLIQGIPMGRKSNKPAGTLLAVTEPKWLKVLCEGQWQLPKLLCVTPLNLHSTFPSEINKYSFRLVIIIRNCSLSIHLFLFHFFPSSTLRVFVCLILMPISDPWRFKCNCIEWGSGTWSFKNTSGDCKVQQSLNSPI